MKLLKWVFVAATAATVSACANMPAEELRSKLAGANVEVAVQSTISEIQFFTRSQEIGQNVMAGNTGLLGVVVGVAISESGRVDSIRIHDGLSTAVANKIRGRLAHVSPGSAESYRLDITDGALFRTANGAGDLFMLQYSVGLTAIDARNGTKLTTLICSGSSQERLPEQEWRISHTLIEQIRQEGINKCSGEFVAKLATTLEAAATPARKKKRK